MTKATTDTKLENHYFKEDTLMKFPDKIALKNVF